MAERSIAQLREELEAERARNLNLEQHIEQLRPLATDSRAAILQIKADMQSAKAETENLMRSAREAEEKSAEVKRWAVAVWREKYDQAHREKGALKQEVTRMKGDIFETTIMKKVMQSIFAAWRQAGTDAGTRRRPVEQRPAAATAVLCGQKLDALATIERDGWHAVKWKNGFTLLHWAAGKGHPELCGYLVRLGGDLEARDGEGRTPMDCAIQAGHAE
eukprot:6030584-Alexandrium_andersonii.AAC.1